MRNKLLIIAAIVLIALSAMLYISIKNNRQLRADVERYASNTSILMQDVERYRTSDSLNAAKVGVLSLKLSEMEDLRAEDIRTIESLKIKKKELEQITTMQMQTIANIKGEVRDSIVYRDKIIRDTVKALNVSDEWIDLHGVIYDDGVFDGTLEVRDSLTIVETVQRKRFLGFLWRTKRIKSREVDVVNKNPYSQIVGIESVMIEQ
jgi:hypothetical protein